MWDYNIDEREIKKLLKEGNETTRIWLITRILENAKFEDIWKYLTLKEIREIFPKLKLKKPIRKAWERALRVWENS